MCVSFFWDAPPPYFRANCMLLLLFLQYFVQNRHSDLNLLWVVPSFLPSLCLCVACGRSDYLSLYQSTNNHFSFIAFNFCSLFDCPFPLHVCFNLTRIKIFSCFETTHSFLLSKKRQTNLKRSFISLFIFNSGICLVPTSGRFGHFLSF